MTYDLFSTSIKFLRLNKIRKTFAVNTGILKYNLQYLLRTEIIALYIDSNRLQLFELDALNMLLKTLKNISAGDNQFTFGKYVGELSVLANVSYMVISHNYLDKEEDCDTISWDNSSCGNDSHYLR